MTLYYVLDSSAVDRQVVLYDSFGGYHLAKAQARVPAIGTELHGSRPMRGYVVLQASFTDEVIGMDFDLVDCGREAAFVRLHRMPLDREDPPRPHSPLIAPYGAVHRQTERD